MPEQTIQTMEQQRSGEAYRMVKNVANKTENNNNKFKGKYKSRASNLPSMVRENGLLQALSFIMAKTEVDEGCKLIGKDIENWINSAVKNGFIPGPVSGNAVTNISDIIEWLTKLDVESYLTVTNEVLNFSVWLKRFAEGMIQDSINKGEPQNDQ